MLEFLVVRSSAIYDFQPLAVSPHLEGEIIGFAEINGDAGRFVLILLCRQTFLRLGPAFPPAGDNLRLSARSAA